MKLCCVLIAGAAMALATAAPAAAFYYKGYMTAVQVPSFSFCAQASQNPNALGARLDAATTEKVPGRRQPVPLQGLYKLRPMTVTVTAALAGATDFCTVTPPAVSFPATIAGAVAFEPPKPLPPWPKLVPLVRDWTYDVQMMVAGHATGQEIIVTDNQDGHKYTATDFFAEGFMLIDEPKQVARGLGCFPPDKVEGHYIHGPSGQDRFNWSFTRFGKPDAGAMLDCRVDRAGGYKNMPPKLKKEVEELFRELDKKGATYQFRQGTSAFATIAVQFPPQYRPNLDKYQAVARKVGLSGPTKAHPNRVQLPKTRH